MIKTIKAVLWTLCVFAVLGLGTYFAGCGDDDNTVDACCGGPIECRSSYDACSKGMCFAVTGGMFECLTACTVAGDACEAGTCYFFGPNSGDFFCGPTGTKLPKDACGAETDCVAGAQCLLQGGTMNCYQVCDAFNACASGTCIDTELGFKVCVAAEEP